MSSTLGSLKSNVTVLAGSFTTGASGTVSTIDAPGVSTIAKTAEGVYKVTLEDRWQALNAGFAEEAGSGRISGVSAEDVDHASAPYVTFTLKTRDTTSASTYVAIGGLVGTPTTASTQASGAAETQWRVDVPRCVAVTSVGTIDVAAEADHVVHDTTELVTNGQSCVAAVVADFNLGTPIFSSIKGTAATTGQQTAPSDSAIDTALGHSNWARLADCTINRTGDTTVTQSEDCSVADLPTISDANNALDVDSGTVRFVLFLQRKLS